jgi:hypothetical protein
VLTYYVTTLPVGSTLAVTAVGGRARKHRVRRGLRTHSLHVAGHNIASLGHLNLMFNLRDIPDLT